MRLIQITEGPEVYLATSLDHLPVKTHNMSNVNTTLQCSNDNCETQSLLIMIHLTYYDKNEYIATPYEFCLQFDHKYPNPGGCMGHC